MHACEEEAPNKGTPIDICDPEVCTLPTHTFPYEFPQTLHTNPILMFVLSKVYALTMNINPNHEDIKNRIRDAKWLKETYQLIKRRGYKIYNNWKVSGLAYFISFLITSIRFLS